MLQDSEEEKLKQQTKELEEASNAIMAHMDKTIKGGGILLEKYLETLGEFITSVSGEQPPTEFLSLRLNFKS